MTTLENQGEPDVEPVVVATFQKNSRELVRVALQTFKGHDLVSVRAFVEDGNGGMKPTKAGIALRAELLPVLYDAIGKAMIAARSGGGR